jgi:hypothetical protein
MRKIKGAIVLIISLSSFWCLKVDASVKVISKKNIDINYEYGNVFYYSSLTEGKKYDYYDPTYSNPSIFHGNGIGGESAMSRGVVGTSMLYLNAYNFNYSDAPKLISPYSDDFKSWMAVRYPKIKFTTAEAANPTFIREYLFKNKYLNITQYVSKVTLHNYDKEAKEAAKKAKEKAKADKKKREVAETISLNKIVKKKFDKDIKKFRATKRPKKFRGFYTKGTLVVGKNIKPGKHVLYTKRKVTQQWRLTRHVHLKKGARMKIVTYWMNTCGTFYINGTAKKFYDSWSGHAPRTGNYLTYNSTIYYKVKRIKYKGNYKVYTRTSFKKNNLKWLRKAHKSKGHIAYKTSGWHGVTKKKVVKLKKGQIIQLKNGIKLK